MPSEKLVRILRSKSPFSEAEIEALSDADGWTWVYKHGAAPKDDRSQICFTGFRAVECAEVEASAEGAAWLKVVQSVTSKLTFLCIGDNPGPAKVKKAGEQGAIVINRIQYAALLKDGELPKKR